jgi:DNA-directed RNA polymerase subunit RPC12/RpoP
MKTIEKCCTKNYRCTECGHESKQDTNHYGEIYIRCSNCSWKSPMSPMQVHECLDPLPEGMGRPEPWKIVRLGDVAEIVQARPAFGGQSPNPITHRR